MKLLITGGSGLVGRFVVDYLHQRHTVEILDIKLPPRSDLVYRAVDILNLEALKQEIREFDAVIHLAGFPHPLNTPPERVFEINALGTYNVLEACAANGIQKFIFLSSESTLGFAFSSHRLWPDYIPVDENHPLRPQDAYGLSKMTAEHLCAGFSARVGMKTVCLRAPWIWLPLQSEILFYQQLIAKYHNWSKNLWAYIHVYDVAQAIELALKINLPNMHEAIFICADDNWVKKDSRQLIARYFPEVSKIADNFEGNASLISNEKAKRLLGFKTRYSWQDVIAAHES